MINFATYPDGIFKGFIKILFYTIIPLGFVNFMPIKIMTIGTDKSKFAKDAISLLFEQIQNKETKKGKKVVEDVYFVNKK